MMLLSLIGILVVAGIIGLGTYYLITNITFKNQTKGNSSENLSEKPEKRNENE